MNETFDLSAFVGDVKLTPVSFTDVLGTALGLNHAEPVMIRGGIWLLPSEYIETDRRKARRLSRRTGVTFRVKRGWSRRRYYYFRFPE